MTWLVLPHYVQGTLHRGILASPVDIDMERECVCVFHPFAGLKYLQWGYLMGLILPYYSWLMCFSRVIHACVEDKRSRLIVFVLRK